MNVEQEELEKLKPHVRDRPKHDHDDFRWPVQETEVKVKSKVNLEKNFRPIWDQSTKEEQRPKDVEEGSSVLVKLTPIFYLGKKSTGPDARFGPGLSLRLHALDVVTKDAAFANLDFELSSKRQKTKTGSAV